MATASLLPYRSTINFIDNIPNKFFNSISNGVPVLSCLEGEVKHLINKHEIGFFYKNHKDLVHNIDLLIESKNKSNKFSENSICTYEKYFEFNKSYDNLVKNIINS